MKGAGSSMLHFHLYAGDAHSRENVFVFYFSIQHVAFKAALHAAALLPAIVWLKEIAELVYLLLN